jgi:hypothetical protein
VNIFFALLMSYVHREADTKKGRWQRPGQDSRGAADLYLAPAVLFGHAFCCASVGHSLSRTDTSLHDVCVQLLLILSLKTSL